MKRFLLLCKRQLMQPAFVIFCVLLPVFCAFITGLEQNSPASVRIGLYAEAPDELTVSCFSELTSGHNSLSFEVFSDEEIMREQVMRGELDCAYSFCADFHNRLLTDDYRDSITCYVSSGTLMKDFSLELVFSSLFAQFGDDILINYAKDGAISFSRKDNITDTRLSELYEQYLHGEQVFSLDYQYLNTLTAEAVTDTPLAVTMPVRGLIAVFLFISGLSGGVTLLQDREKKLPVPALTTIFIPLLFMTISSCVTLALTGEAGQWGKELLLLGIYMLIIIVFVRVLLLFIKRPVILSASIPVLTLGSLIFCPIFINLAALLPFFEIMEKFFLPYYYLLLS